MVDLNEIVLEIRHLAEKSPDYVYEPPEGRPCLYMHDTGPGCIVGHALTNLGVTLRPQDEGLRATQLLRSLGIVPQNIYSDEANWIEWVQDAQDDGKPWLYAVERADDAGQQIIFF